MDTALQFLLDNMVQIVSWAGLAVAYIVDKKKRKLETADLEGNLFNKMQAAYKIYIEDAQKEYAELLEKVKGLEEREARNIALISSQQSQILELQQKLLEKDKTIKKLLDRLKIAEENEAILKNKLDANG